MIKIILSFLLLITSAFAIWGLVEIYDWYDYDKSDWYAYKGVMLLLPCMFIVYEMVKSWV